MLADFDSVDGLNSIRETCADLERVQDQDGVQTLRQEKSTQHAQVESSIGCPTSETGTTEITRSWGRRVEQPLGKEKFKDGSL